MRYLCIRLTWNLTGSCGQQQRLRGWSRMVVKQFQDGGRPPFWKSIYRQISVKNHQIFMKFCTQQQILNWMNVMCSKMKNFQNSRWRTAAILKIVISLLSQWRLKPSASKTITLCSTCIIPAPPANCQFIWMASAFGMSTTQPILG